MNQVVQMFKAFSLQTNTAVHIVSIAEQTCITLFGGSNTYSAANYILTAVAQQAVDPMNSGATFVASYSAKRLVVSNL